MFFKSGTEVKVIIRKEDNPEEYHEEIGLYLGSGDSGGLLRHHIVNEDGIGSRKLIIFHLISKCRKLIKRQFS